jgi:hypothetical protein
VAGKGFGVNLPKIDPAALDQKKVFENMAVEKQTLENINQQLNRQLLEKEQEIRRLKGKRKMEVTG